MKSKNTFSNCGYSFLCFIYLMLMSAKNEWRAAGFSRYFECDFAVYRLNSSAIRFRIDLRSCNISPDQSSYENIKVPLIFQ